MALTFPMADIVHEWNGDLNNGFFIQLVLCPAIRLFNLIECPTDLKYCSELCVILVD